MNEPDQSRGDKGVADIRGELKDELLRAARSREGRRPLARRLAPLVVGVALVAVPATLAVAELSSDEEGPVTVTAQPAPAPLFAPGGAFSHCPDEVQELIVELDDLDAYAESPGYPVAGCPTTEEIEEARGPIDAIAPEDALQGEGTIELSPESAVRPER